MGIIFLGVLCGLAVSGGHNAGIFALLDVMAVMLKRIAALIVEVTLSVRAKRHNSEVQPQRIYLPGPKVPKFIWNLIQRE